MTASGEPLADARRRPRPRVALRGQLLHGIHRESVDVVVRNLTDGGAKVRLVATNGARIAPPLILRIASVDRPCVLAWRAGDEVGLKFAQAPA